MEKPSVCFRDLGKMGYQEAWDLQTELHAATVARKKANRERVKAGEPAGEQFHHLLFVEHPPVYTLGKSGSLDHLLLDEAQLEAQGFTFHRINRGGDITYHGPGQLVAYPILDLEEFFTDVHKYVRCSKRWSSGPALTLEFTLSATLGSRVSGCQEIRHEDRPAVKYVRSVCT